MAKDEWTKEERDEIDKEARRRLAVLDRQRELEQERQPSWKEGDQNRRKADRRKPPAPKKEKKSGIGAFFE